MMNLDPIEMAVTIAGIVLIGFTPWFLLPRRLRPARLAAVAYQEVLVKIAHDRFNPSTIVLAAGVPAKIRFQRIDGSEEWETFVAPGLSIERKLPAAKTTTIDITADEPGIHPFHSGVVKRNGTIVIAVK